MGGDFYDFLQLSSGEWMGVLADVSGKGMSAALLSSMVLGALSMEFRSGTQPQDVLNRVNRLLCEKSLPFQFVTLFLLPEPGWRRGNSSARDTIQPICSVPPRERSKSWSPDAFALGMFESACYQSRKFHLDGGDLLVVYSDGLTDAENPQEEMFGEERLLEIIQQEAPSGSHALEQKILKGIEDFTQGMPQTDDITFVVVEKSL